MRLLIGVGTLLCAVAFAGAYVWSARVVYAVGTVPFLIAFAINLHRADKEYEDGGTQ